MTTLQTHSVHNETSADSIAARAQSTRFTATIAPIESGSFADVLGAFTAVEPDDSVDQSDETESTDESASGEEDSGTTESSSNESDAEEADSLESSKDESVDTAPRESQSEKSPKVESAADWSKVLTNAASINLADLATSQLEGQAASTKSESQAVHRDQSQSSQHTKTTAEDQPNSLLNQRGIGRSLVVTAGQSQQSDASSTASHAVSNNTPTDHQAPMKDQQVQRHEQAQQQVNQPAKVQAVQAVQPQTTDQGQSVKRTQGSKSISQIEGVTSEARAVGGNGSSGKMGQGQSGLDLGDRSQQAMKTIQQSKSSEDQAIQRKEVIAQVQRGLASIMNTKGGTMKIRLTPEHLGEVNIQLMTKDGHVSVKIEAEHEQTKHMLKDGLESLKSAMEARGATVDSLTVESKDRSGFDQLLNQSDVNSDDQQRESGNRSDTDNNDQSKNASNTHSPDESETGVDADTSNQPQSIWTQLGLDAIA
ncbi:MAG: flagellar hook-length control protein FliK [Phycisphaerales bacterium]|nr:flagellar hook-length control protein FliK [Phycisphaerales bacterium]